MIGTSRRVRALIALGWPEEWLASRLGVTAQEVQDAANGIPIPVNACHRIRAGYEVLSAALPAPRSPLERELVTVTRQRAEARGWPPPLAWEDDELDDPDAEALPVLRPPCSRLAFDADDIEHLLTGSSYSWSSMAARLGVGVETLRRRLNNWGRIDLIRQLNQTADRGRILRAS